MMRRAPPDTGKTLEFKKSKVMFTIYFMVGFGLLVGALYLCREVLEGRVDLPFRLDVVANGLTRDGVISRPEEFVWILPGFIALILVLVWLYYAWMPKVVLRLAPSGFRDLRASKMEIPWSHIRSVTSLTHQAVRYIILGMPHSQIEDINLTWAGRIVQDHVGGKAPEGLYINAMDLNVSTRKLERLVAAYQGAHSNSGNLGRNQEAVF